MPDRVTILMAVYQGAAYLDAQLRSIAGQQGVDWHLVASDDGSTDASPEILRRFAREWSGRVTLLRGPGRGSVANFLHLMQCVQADAGFVALADQDDVWLPGKLARAVGALGSVPGGRPALYASAVTTCDTALQPLAHTPRRRTPPGFRNALVQNLAPGHTMVLNPAGISAARDFMPRTECITVHDWWLYQLVAALGGDVVYDNVPGVLYRQHGANQIGNARGLRLWRQRWRRLWNDDLSGWSARTIAGLEPAGAAMPPENRQILAAFTTLHSGPLPSRLGALRRAGLYHETRAGQFGLWLAALLGKF